MCVVVVSVVGNFDVISSNISCVVEYEGVYVDIDVSVQSVLNIGFGFDVGSGVLSVVVIYVVFNVVYQLIVLEVIVIIVVKIESVGVVRVFDLILVLGIGCINVIISLVVNDWS